MPTLNWIGKEKVINHHQDVPYKILEPQYTFSNGKEDKNTTSDNKIIHGDNLEALKSLLPEYEGKIKCIYIDPPYNTGNEGWVYNDNVNHPKLKKWLGQVVGKESEDLSRHDKWLCMMYPRLKLLHKLLADNGLIFISIDENEIHNLRLLCNELFAESNFRGCISRATGTPTGQGNLRVANEIDYILIYSKSSNSEILGLPFTEEDKKIYNKSDKRGLYLTRTLRKTGGEDRREDRPNMYFPILSPKGEEVFPIGPTGYESRWRCSNETYLQLEEDGMIEWTKNKNGDLLPYLKFYLEGRTKQVGNLWTGIEGNKKASTDVKSIFKNKVFDTPKPIELVSRCIQISTKDNDIILDSFAGSGTTAHAVLNLNKEDGGNRKFILVEMEDYANTITAERVKRVINGYGEGSKAIEGTGGDFTYYELGESLFLDNGFLNEAISLDKILEYVWYSEAKTPFVKPKEDYLLGAKNDTAYYFYYQKDSLTTLDESFLRSIKTKASQYIIYADNCLLDQSIMDKYNIVFKKIPRDITRF
ncbi:site-specific DNA-methyltransferase [Tenacibaculum sp. SSH1-16]|uniref:site-specific DNA-methyltransferase n=1 Tax=Tenacibaculum sp. SSH1-16 TaxID=3136667 RepID=UPI0032C47BB8